MSAYINLGNEAFATIRRGEYMDKSGLIAVVNNTLNTRRCFSCVTRSRRFGKSMAAEMLCAYYDHSCDSRELFADLEIARDPSFDKYLNTMPVIYLDLTAFVTRFHDEDIVNHIDAELRAEVAKTYQQVDMQGCRDLMDCLIRIANDTRQKFFFIIDEWDAICREFPAGTPAMDRYVTWLRRMFKVVNATSVFAGVYMTGILPIKKYKTESALNNFMEYSMVEPGNMGRYFGFTKDEVQALATEHAMSFDELEKWYDGYQIGDELSMFNPNSVMQAVNRRRCRSYWASTGAFDSVVNYIQMNFQGLKDDIILMLAGGRCKVNPTKFQNDMSVINNRDDVLTVLIHLGYLSYNWRRDECYIPNHEVMGEMANAVEANNWTPVVNALEASDQLLQDILCGEADAVARAVEAIHDDNTSILSYNNENSLACVLSLALYTARNQYVIHRELPTGKGFADIVLMPRKNVSSPAIIVELKVNRDADSAITQIHRRQYPAKLAQYTGELLLVGLNYDRDTKQHTCQIETLQAPLS